MNIQQTMESYLDEISDCVKANNLKGVIHAINEMKNFYMVQTGMKQNVKKDEPKKEIVKAVGREYNIPPIDLSKPRKNIFY